MLVTSKNPPASDGRTVDAKQLVCQRRLRFQRLMYPLRLALEIRVERASDDARVLESLIM
jgi:hypothetical protein